MAQDQAGIHNWTQYKKHTHKKAKIVLFWQNKLVE